MNKYKLIAWALVAGAALLFLALIIWAYAAALRYLYTTYSDFFVGCGCGLIRIACVLTLIQAAILTRRLWIRSRNN